MIRPKVLVLTPRFPYPVVGGDRLRIFELCREMSRHYDLTLLSLCESEEEMLMPIPLDGVFHRVEREFLPQWRSRLNALAALPTGTPLQVAYYRSKKFADRVRTLLPSHDGCIAHLIRAGSYVRSASVPTVLEMTDAISMNYKRVRDIAQKRSFRSWIYRIETNRLLRYERKIIDDFSLVTLVSEFDRDFLLQGAKREHVIVCSNGVNLESLPFVNRSVCPPVAVYIGNMLSLQNMDACTFFIEEVLPLIRARMEFVFRIVGRITVGDAKMFRKYEGVEVRENVDSIPEAVRDARVGVAPVRVGAGVQNKVLEYMALGLPVISSSVALEGLKAEVGLDLLVADTPKEYVKALEVLWRDVDMRKKLAENGLKYVQNHHSWTARIQPMIDSLSRIMSSGNA